MQAYYKEGSGWSSTAFVVVSFCGFIFVEISVFINFVNLQEFCGILKDMKFIDEKFLKVFNLKFNYKKESRNSKKIFLISFLIFQLVMNSSMLISLLCSENFDTSKASQAIPLFAIYYGILTYAALFLVLVSMVRKRIEILRENLENLMEGGKKCLDVKESSKIALKVEENFLIKIGKTSKKIDTFESFSEQEESFIKVQKFDQNLSKFQIVNENLLKSQKLPQTLILNNFYHQLKTLSIIHLKVEELTSKINKIFAFPMIILFLLNLIGLTFSLYEDFVVLRNLNRPNAKEIKFVFAVGANFSNFYFFLNILANIIFCSLAKRDSKNLIEKLYENFHKIKNRKILRRFKIFLMQLKHAEVKFGCGLCDFDWKLLYGVRKFFIMKLYTIVETFK
jgi:hypothetical protein